MGNKVVAKAITNSNKIENKPGLNSGEIPNHTVIGKPCEYYNSCDSLLNKLSLDSNDPDWISPEGFDDHQRNYCDVGNVNCKFYIQKKKGKN